MGCMYPIGYPKQYSDVITDGSDKGIIPLTCSELFVRVEEKTAADTSVSFTVEVSYIEVRRNIRLLFIISNIAAADIQ
jgi:hypothetical protein